MFPPRQNLHNPDLIEQAASLHDLNQIRVSLFMEFEMKKVRFIDFGDEKGIWVPLDLWFNKNLSLIEKTILIEIDSLDHGNGCPFNDKYFSEYSGLSTTSVMDIISKLYKIGYITYEDVFVKNTDQIEYSLLKVNFEALERN